MKVIDTCGNCHQNWPCDCNDPVWVCGVCGSDQYDCMCFESTSGEIISAKDTEEESERSGYIYLLLALTEGKPIKIGRSKTPEERTAWIGLRVPFETIVSHVFYADDMYSAESKLHDLFTDKRRNGEWFNLTNEDVKYIFSIEEYRNGDFIKHSDYIKR